MKFTKEVKENWLKALKSGEYKQGFMELYDEKKDAYCCIGVLGHITEGLSSDSSCEEEQSPYKFLHSSIGHRETTELYKKNDSNVGCVNYEGGFANVIPTIELLPTQD